MNPLALEVNRALNDCRLTERERHVVATVCLIAGCSVERATLALEQIHVSRRIRWPAVPKTEWGDEVRRYAGTLSSCLEMDRDRDRERLQVVRASSEPNPRAKDGQP
jgi:hypothetical protein